MGSVSLRNVSKSFGSVDVIRNVSLDIEEGEFCVLIGPSGSGKSTLLRIIAGLEEVSSGEISIANRVVTDEEPKERDIAMVFQTYALYPQMTVRENMGFALKLAKMPKKEIAAKVEKTARMLELDHLLDRLPKDLSGGQRQRVSMGRAIVRNPSVFLFDEPLSNLDAKLRTQVRGEIADLHQSLGTTSVYVTHDQIEAMTLGQKIVVLKDGMVYQCGSPLQLYQDPDNTFVAGFLGSPSINLINCIAVKDSHGLFAKLPSGDIIQLDPDLNIADGCQIVIGIRPEHLSVEESEHPEGFKAVIHTIENTGSDMVVMCHLPSFSLKAAFKEQKDLTVGQEISLVPYISAVLVFDQKTGHRIRACV
ncbi:ABC transporter ATP-binding protein [Vibrio quintilis]|uniref:sn-glycerol-3-phosphate import ATP-binding protein UgpC n=1 Tax=Vibrio quintilis TaxID=1117707 RepID=A0A1M7YPT2_9VIBR|nr:sn-glycerol-3-phosphate ABC transporter ATP-binding protein UgpC [Vibrio quintilis]SHO54638.1 sn-glycerol-3-phosphate import ATP-binding protein UgpC [Vibrio quintilis]